MSPLELESRDLKQMALITISRPFRMIFHESIVSLSSLYLALAYAIFYLYFEAYPIIFQGLLILSISTFIYQAAHADTDDRNLWHERWRLRFDVPTE